MTATDADVLVVGWGLVGRVTAILLAQRGWRVTVLERWPESYPFPRAVHFDGETARILATAGVGDRLDEVGDAAVDYEFQNAQGQVLLRFDLPADPPGVAGWPKSIVFHQPALERVLAERAAELPTLSLLRGVEVIGCDDRGDHVEVQTTERTFTASWTIGCDGANSVVRGAIGATITDLGLFYDWLLCDLVLNEPREFRPNNLQICDPARPTTVVSGGLDHRRWEFMRLPGEDIAELNKLDTAWKLLAPHGITPDNATLHRHTVYTFRAQWVDDWRLGRILLAGDAAHLMPPFSGQGVCAGIRDAANLAWKLDHVLAGRFDQSVLDTYTTERLAHVRHYITMATDMGRMVCELDEERAAARDAFMLSGTAEPPQLRGVPLTDGLLHKQSDRAGEYMPQGRVRSGDRAGLFDDVVSPGFVFLAAGDPDDLLSPPDRAWLAELGTQFVGLAELSDVDGLVREFLADSAAVLVRPDRYVFGAVNDRDQTATLVDDLRLQSSGGMR